jgi:hypothetical protein
MRAKPKQLDLDLEAIESIRQLAGALQVTVDDLSKRLAPQTTELSARIVLQHCEKALRIARGAPMAPYARSAVDAAYKMVKRELAA